jgi:hypothetical protein
MRSDLSTNNFVGRVSDSVTRRIEVVNAGLRYANPTYAAEGHKSIA